MVARRPTVLVLAEAQSRASLEDPPSLDYTWHIVLPAEGKTEEAPNGKYLAALS